MILYKTEMNYFEKLFYKLKCYLNLAWFELTNYFNDAIGKISIKQLLKILEEEFMANFQKLDYQKIMNDIICSYGDDKSTNTISKEEIEKFLQQKVDEEYEQHMVIQKNIDPTNYRNGRRKKKFIINGFEIELLVPNNRKNTFTCSFLFRYIKYSSELIKEIVALVPINSINAIYKMFKDRGINISKHFITKIRNQFKQEARQIYKNRRIPHHVDVVDIDAFYVSIGDKNVDIQSNIKKFITNRYYSKQNIFSRKVCVIQAFGKNLETGEKIDLGFMICDSESKQNYYRFWNMLNSKGLKSFDLLVSDDLKNIRESARIVYGQNFEFQKCFIHTKRALLKKFSKEDKETINWMFNRIANANCVSDVKSIVAECLESIKNLDKWKLNWIISAVDNLTTFLKYPKCVRKIIYTNNFIECQNKMIKMTIKWKGLINNEQALYDSILISKVCSRSIHRNINIKF